MGKGIVITGVGVVSPVATGKRAFWKALSEGKTGFRPITLFDSSPFQCRIAGEITDFDPLPILGKKGLRDLDRSTRLLCSAARFAIEDSKLDITDSNTNRIGVAVGATFGSLHSISQFDLTTLLEGPRAVNPSRFPNTVINSPASQVSIRYKIKGFNTTISTGFCAGLDAVCYAADFIRMGRADIVLAGGVEELCEETFQLFHDLGYLSGSDGSEPICCPFDSRRNGFIASEGASMLVLQEEDDALLNTIPVLARILGWGNSFDPCSDGSFELSGHGLSDAIYSALRDASCGPGDIDYVCSSANSTQGLDAMETRVIKMVFGEHVQRMPISSIKSMIGDSYSASGAMAIAAATGALQTGMIPPTVNYIEKDDACDLDYVIGSVREKNVEKVLVTAADPYGLNSAVILGK